MQTLLLFDIDGTLMRGAADAQARALHIALAEVYGVSGTATVEVRTSGRTDLEIARILARGVRVKDHEFDLHREIFKARWIELHEEFCVEPLHERVLPGVPEMLAQVAADERYRLSLVTGNLEQVAWRKLEQTGLAKYFQSGQGGFGSDDEVRDHLPGIARARAGGGKDPWLRDKTIVIGDTPRDIACARADGVQVVAVATGEFQPHQLIEADLVVASAEEITEALERLT